MYNVVVPNYVKNYDQINKNNSIIVFFKLYITNRGALWEIKLADMPRDCTLPSDLLVQYGTLTL